MTVLVTLIILSQTASSTAAAIESYEQGVLFFDRGNYEAALAEFESAYKQLENRPERSVLLFNIGQSHERLFRYDAALEYYRRYLDESGPDAAVEATIRTLEGLVATLEIQVSAALAEVWVDERKVGQAPGRIRVAGGRHVVELRAPGYLPSRQEIMAPARSSQQLRFDLEPIPEDRGLTPVFFWSSTGAAAVAAAIGVGFGVAAYSSRSSVDGRAGNVRDQFLNDSSEQRKIRDLSRAADIAYAGAALFGAGAAILYQLTDWEQP